jgi:hypothetical protein
MNITTFLYVKMCSADGEFYSPLENPDYRSVGRVLNTSGYLFYSLENIFRYLYVHGRIGVYVKTEQSLKLDAYPPLDIEEADIYSEMRCVRIYTHSEFIGVYCKMYPQLLITALNSDSCLYIDIPFEMRTHEYTLYALRQNPHLVINLRTDDFNDEICKYLLLVDAYNYRYFPLECLTEEICMLAVDLNSNVIELYVRAHRTLDVMMRAIEGNPSHIRYLSLPYTNVKYLTPSLILSLVQLHKSRALRNIPEECMTDNILKYICDTDFGLVKDLCGYYGMSRMTRVSHM